MTTLLEHLQHRHLDVQLHNPVIDVDTDVVTFYLWNLSGNLVGYQQYRRTGEKAPNNNPKFGKYYTRKTPGTLALWGIESLYLSPNVVFLCEGVFDACRLTKRGYSALAVLSNNSNQELRNWLTTLSRRVVAVCDNDAAGKKLAKFGDVAVFCKEHDLGDASDEFVTELLLKYG